MGPVTLAFNNEPVQAHYCAQAQRGAVSSEKTPLARGEVGSIECTSSISAPEQLRLRCLSGQVAPINGWLDALTLSTSYFRASEIADYITILPGLGEKDRQKIATSPPRGFADFSQHTEFSRM